MMLVEEVRHGERHPATPPPPNLHVHWPYLCSRGSEWRTGFHVSSPWQFTHISLIPTHTHTHTHIEWTLHPADEITSHATCVKSLTAAKTERTTRLYRYYTHIHDTHSWHTSRPLLTHLLLTIWTRVTGHYQFQYNTISVSRQVRWRFLGYDYQHNPKYLHYFTTL